MGDNNVTVIEYKNRFVCRSYYFVVPTGNVNDEGNSYGRSSLRKSKTIDFGTGYFYNITRAHVLTFTLDFFFWTQMKKKIKHFFLYVPRIWTAIYNALNLWVLFSSIFVSFWIDLETVSINSPLDYGNRIVHNSVFRFSKPGSMVPMPRVQQNDW